MFLISVLVLVLELVLILVYILALVLMLVLKVSFRNCTSCAGLRSDSGFCGATNPGGGFSFGSAPDFKLVLNVVVVLIFVP